MAFALLFGSIRPVRAQAAAVDSVDLTSPPEQAQNALLQVVPPSTVQDILLDVCVKRGYAQDCAKHLLGMLWKESNNNPRAVGDHGLAHGYFQINHYYNPEVSVECAEDLRCSANWTLGYLEKHSYPKYVHYAIQCHNGCNFVNHYADQVLYHGRRLWNQPLFMNDDAARLALNN